MNRAARIQKAALAKLTGDVEWARFVEDSQEAALAQKLADACVAGKLKTLARITLRKHREPKRDERSTICRMPD